MSYFSNDRLKQLFFIILILLLGGILFWQSVVFIPGFLGAFTLYVLMRRSLFFLVRRKKWKRTWTAILLMLASFVIILLPVALFINLMYSKIGFMADHSQEIVAHIRHLAEQIRSFTHFDILSDNTIQKAQEALTRFLPKFLGSTINFISTIVIMYFILYFMLTQFEEMETTLYENIPLKEENVQKLSTEVINMVISNAVGIPLLCIVQAVFAMLGYWIFGAGDFVFWGVLTGLMSFIPLVGTAIVWVPLGIYMIASGDTWQGIGILVFGVVVISNLDNVFRFIWQKKMADVHPMVTVFGVLIGIPLFGFLGIIFGPLLISLFILLLKIYRDEFSLRRSRIKIVEE